MDASRAFHRKYPEISRDISHHDLQQRGNTPPQSIINMKYTTYAAALAGHTAPALLLTSGPNNGQEPSRKSDIFDTNVHAHMLSKLSKGGIYVLPCTRVHLPFTSRHNGQSNFSQGTIHVRTLSHLNYHHFECFHLIFMGTLTAVGTTHVTATHHVFV
jgi:hypothetical protein